MPDDSQPTNSEPANDKANLIDAVVNETADQSPVDSTSTEASKDSGKKAKKEKPQPTTFAGKLWYNWVKPVGSVILVVVILRSSIIDWNDVPSGSMEPTILVGDRILVNKLAFALQPPFAGPKIGIPFTPLQWDNPLDGLPAWQWGEPKRGDIVTFWNPDSGVRMVKRIVAQSGDTVEMRGGQLFINGETASYIDNTTSPRRVGSASSPPNPPNMVTYEDMEETILGETRNIQYIKKRWVASWGRLRFSGGREHPTFNGMADTSLVGNPNGIPRESEDGTVYQLQHPNHLAPVEDLLAQDANAIHLQIIDGVPLINDESVSFMEFAAVLLEPIASDEPVVFGAFKVHASSSDWLIDGESASTEQVRTRLTQAGYLGINGNAPENQPDPLQKDLILRMGTLRSLLFTSFGPIALGDDEYFMVGDNRNNSHDSRYFGPVQRSEITGEAIFIPFSFNGRIRDLSPRWGRTFHGLE